MRAVCARRCRTSTERRYLGFGQGTDYGRFFADTLADADVEVEARCRCVAAMFDLYEKLFSPFPAETATYMWWDLIATSVLRHAHRDIGRQLHATHERVRLEMVSTLMRILALEARHCQEAALHGLNHVANAAERALAIEQLLRLRQPDAKLREYALACLAGRAQ
jgi:hypothetical protein